MDTLPKAIALGWGRLYLTLPEFRETFRETMSAVDSLPPELVRRGRALGYPPLHHACIQGDVELVEALLKAGISPDTYPFTEDETDEPPLIWLTIAEGLSTQKKIEVASLLLRFGADVEEGDALSFAMQSGDEAFAAFLTQSRKR
jgi:hypothetical protein